MLNSESQVYVSSNSQGATDSCTETCKRQIGEQQCVSAMHSTMPQINEQNIYYRDDDDNPLSVGANFIKCDVKVRVDLINTRLSCLCAKIPR